VQEAKNAFMAAAEEFSKWIRDRVMAQFPEVDEQMAARYTLNVVDIKDDKDPRQAGATALLVTTSGAKLREYLTGDEHELQHITRQFPKRCGATAVLP
jgi:hypothetical protein